MAGNFVTEGYVTLPAIFHSHPKRRKLYTCQLHLKLDDLFLMMTLANFFKAIRREAVCVDPHASSASVINQPHLSAGVRFLSANIYGWIVAQIWPASSPRRNINHCAYSVISNICRISSEERSTTSTRTPRPSGELLHEVSGHRLQPFKGEDTDAIRIKQLARP